MTISMNCQILLGFESRFEFMNKCKRILFCGPSKSGKTFIGRALYEYTKIHGQNSFLIDGDQIRNTLNTDLGFSKEDILENMRRVGELANWLDSYQNASHVIATVIAPLKEARQLLCKKYGFTGFFVNRPEVYELDESNLKDFSKRSSFEPISEDEGIETIANPASKKWYPNWFFLETLLASNQV